MVSMRITPNNIQELKPNEIFVFGSNLSGFHGGGAAKLAFDKFGAEWENGEGMQGQSYALPTKDKTISTLPLEHIEMYVFRFISFARYMNKYTFLVTKIGCGLAFYTPKEIAPLFYKCKEIDNIFLPIEFWEILNKTP